MQCIESQKRPQRLSLKRYDHQRIAAYAKNQKPQGIKAPPKKCTKAQRDSNSKKVYLLTELKY